MWVVGEVKGSVRSGALGEREAGGARGREWVNGGWDRRRIASVREGWKGPP